MLSYLLAMAYGGGDACDCNDTLALNKANKANCFQPGKQVPESDSARTEVISRRDSVSFRFEEYVMNTRAS